MVLDLCGIDFAVPVQVERAVHGRDQATSTDRARVSAAWCDVLAVTSDGAGRAVGMAVDSSVIRASTVSPDKQRAHEAFASQVYSMTVRFVWLWPLLIRPHE